MGVVTIHDIKELAFEKELIWDDSYIELNFQEYIGLPIETEHLSELLKLSASCLVNTILDYYDYYADLLNTRVSGRKFSNLQLRELNNIGITKIEDAEGIGSNKAKQAASLRSLEIRLSPLELENLRAELLKAIVGLSKDSFRKIKRLIVENPYVLISGYKVDQERLNNIKNVINAGPSGFRALVDQINIQLNIQPKPISVGDNDDVGSDLRPHHEDVNAVNNIVARVLLISYPNLDTLGFSKSLLLYARGSTFDGFQTGNYSYIKNKSLFYYALNQVELYLKKYGRTSLPKTIAEYLALSMSNAKDVESMTTSILSKKGDTYLKRENMTLKELYASLSK